MIRRAKQRQSVTESNTDAICAEKGCRPFYVQTPSVRGANADLSSVTIMVMKNYNLKLLGIEYEGMTAKRG